MVGYTDWEMEECWKTFPDSNASTLYTIRDMEHLISERQCLGITTCEDLANFHTAYFGLTQWLISKGYISKQEQQRGYMQAIPQSLIPAVTTRLQIVHPLHNPLLPYEVDAIFKATRFALQSSAAFLPAYFAPRQPAQQPQPAQIARATSQSRTLQHITS
ncbi:hypothetical protein BYT27DRAFT_7258358 [Phlegmacium glaucopus]|nr:hypothetical protein BYT27DRAFT_7258358 [Phlegmacium glaucopus]